MEKKQRKRFQMNWSALFYMMLLAVQFGVQPILTRRYTSPGIIKSTVILTQEVVKFVIAWIMLNLSGASSECFKGWTVTEWLSVALVPAGLYSIQNMAALTAYQNLDALTFNTLNQTKTLSAALCCYLVMGRKQSWVQVFSLFLLLLSALIMEGVVTPDMLLLSVQTSPSLPWFSAGWDGRHFTLGVAPILLASFTSGLAGALSQKNLQAVGGGRNAYLFTMELCAASCLILLISLSISADGQRIKAYGFWDGWKTSTFIPILTNSAGGIIVGLVTKYAGSVRKGFALIFGIFLSGIIQAIMQPEMKITQEQVVGGTVAALSLYLHSTNPPFKRAKQD